MKERATRSISLGSFIVLFVALLALVAQAGFHTLELRRESAALETRLAQQRPVVERSQKLRQQLQSIAAATAALAEQGNPNAVLVRDQLQQQGISLGPSPSRPE